ncbi:uncharacterized protein [Arachis hypogaea]|uniref:uncharacterized protein n=1 Tax=Arachis hypogaea TaxID=3818 RepID=UPI003B219508
MVRLVVERALHLHYTALAIHCVKSEVSKCTYHFHLPSIKLSFPFQKLIKQDSILIKAALHVHQALWYKILELRFLLQKPFSSSNRQPRDPVKSLFCKPDENVRVAYSDLITSYKETLDSILELQEERDSITKRVRK